VTNSLEKPCQIADNLTPRFFLKEAHGPGRTRRPHDRPGPELPLHAWRPGIDPWTPHELNRWAAGPASGGERRTARFLFAVWDPATDWEAGPFDVLEALRVWDLSHREAFLDWAADPWWP
jgi:hypothetical protein